VGRPLVTIGIPFYNTKDTLLGAIKSIFAQTFEDWELLLVDDGSSDGSLDIVRSVEDARLKVFSDGQNKKLPTRLNQIIDLARGKYIARMDADDLCSPKRIEKQLQFLEKNQSIDLVGTRVIYLDENDTLLGCNSSSESHSEICVNPARMFMITHPTVVARRAWYRRNRYDEDAFAAEDFNLWLRTFQDSTFANIPDLVYYYRLNKYRLNQTFNFRKRLRARYFCAKFIFEHYKKEGDLYKAIYGAGVQYVKFVATMAMFSLGIRRNFVTGRFRPLTSEDKNLAIEDMEKIRDFELPLRRQPSI